MKPTIDELRAMAERVAKVRAAEWESTDELVRVYNEMYGKGEPTSYDPMEDDESELVDFACEMLDQRPADESFVRSLNSLVRDDDSCVMVHLTAPNGNNVGVTWEHGVRRCIVSFWTKGATVFISCETRGDVLMLLMALKVEIKKGGEA